MALGRLFAVALGAGLALSACGSGGSPGVRDGSPFQRDAPRSRAVVWAAGDGADGGPGARAVAGLVERARPDVFLYLGDVYPDGTADSFAESYASTFGRLADRTSPTPGNHDWPKHGEGYAPYWTKARGVAPPSYYSFHAGGWELLSLNSEARGGLWRAQLRWLRRRLERPGDCRIAFWHRPRWSAGTVHGDNRDVDPLWQALRGHARLVLNGHEHDLQLLRRDGLIEVVAGAGGHSFYGLRRRYDGLSFADRSDFGAVRLVLRPGTLTLTFVTIAGRSLGERALQCVAGRAQPRASS